MNAHISCRNKLTVNTLGSTGLACNFGRRDMMAQDQSYPSPKAFCPSVGMLIELLHLSLENWDLPIPPDLATLATYPPTPTWELLNPKVYPPPIPNPDPSKDGNVWQPIDNSC